jgi:hypothetical protein
MNEIITVRVQPCTMGRGTLGRTAGAVIRAMLIAAIDGKPGDSAVKLSLQGVDKIDTGFAAEAVVALFAHYRGKRAMVLADVGDPDTFENIAAAAERANEPITLHEGSGVRVIGRAPTRGTRAALDFALARPEVRAADYARDAGITAQNASNKFKQLWQQGFLLRTAGTSASGGAEHTYRRIG